MICLIYETWVFTVSNSVSKHFNIFLYSSLERSRLSVLGRDAPMCLLMKDIFHAIRHRPIV